MKTLVVEDDEALRDMLVKFLEQRGHDTAAFADAESAWTAYQKKGFPLVILDWRLSGRMDGLELCRNIRASDRGDLSVVLAVTGRNQPEDLRAMLDAGADDYVVKPLDMKILEVRLTIAERRARDLAALFEAKEGAGARRSSFQGMIGKSARMQETYRRIELAADSDIPVMLLGESGAGKELAARAIHTLSHRKDNPFLAVNCAAIPEPLLESELFGHVKGAFTGAVQDRIGIFQTAEAGTLFLDEIGDLHPGLQLKLLRVLEQKEVRRVGDRRATKIDARIVTATNKNPRDLVTSGGMREDFYYRIHGFEIVLPPLCDRREDIPLLVEHFIAEYAAAQMTERNPRGTRPDDRRESPGYPSGGRVGEDGSGKKTIKGLARDALQRLVHHPWPGNVRQLKHAVEQACVAAKGDRITLADLPEDILHPPDPKSGPSSEAPPLTPEKQAERLRVMDVLKSAGQNRQEAAKLLGISRISLWRKMKKLGIE